ncbi:hypothetical protein EVAR_38332_1 [Eumeta japonica]|uniref:Uncharacterized protein n=1 Tax=Eumeta variegata TaxID=151549 RepID=A0A4C1X3G3_EUMVA|nr:hypothetical protein EVAR_38332_1 [Eumeta japonica]
MRRMNKKEEYDLRDIGIQGLRNRALLLNMMLPVRLHHLSENTQVTFGSKFLITLGGWELHVKMCPTDIRDRETKEIEKKSACPQPKPDSSASVRIIPLRRQPCDTITYYIGAESRKRHKVVQSDPNELCRPRKRDNLRPP